MADDKKEPWLNYLALTTVILAVCATFSTFRGGGFSTQRILNQNLASDVWSQYQSKSIKGYLNQMSKDKLELELKAMGPIGTELKNKDTEQGKVGKKEIDAGTREEAGTLIEAKAENVAGTTGREPAP